MTRTTLKGRPAIHTPEVNTAKRLQRPAQRQARRETELTRMQQQCKQVDSLGTKRPARLH